MIPKNISIPFLKKIGGISSIIKSKLTSWWYSLPFTTTEIVNKIGDQDRVAAGGEVFTGRAHAYDGVDQYAYIADNGSLDIKAAVDAGATDFCFGGYITTGSDITSIQNILGKRNLTNNNGKYGLYINAGALRIEMKGSGPAVDIADNITLAVNTNYHILIKIDLVDLKMYFYINGILQNTGGTAFTGTFANVDNAYGLAFGSSYGGGYYFNGKIRDVRIYHKDVSSSANQTAWMNGERLGDEVLWLPCEDTDLTNTFDASGNDYHLTNANHDSTSFVEGNWVSIYNKYGYGIDVGGANLVPDASSNFETDGTTWWNNYTLSSKGWNATTKDMTLVSSGSFIGVYMNGDLNYKKFILSFKAKSTNNTNPFIFTNDFEDIETQVNPNLTTEYQEYLVVGTEKRHIDRIYIYASSVIGNNLTLDDIVIKPYYDTAIPPDLSTLVNGIPTTDIFGNALTFKGQAKYNAQSVESASILGDGVISGTITGLLTTDVITSESSDTPTCTTNGEMIFADTEEYYGITITRSGVVWAVIPMCEGEGTTCHDVNGGGHHLTLVDSDSSNWGLQDSYHYLRDYGVGFAGQFNGVDSNIQYGTSINSYLDIDGNWSIAFIIKLNDITTLQSIISSAVSAKRATIGINSGNLACTLYDGSFVNVSKSGLVIGEVYRCVITNASKTVSVYVDGVANDGAQGIPTSSTSETWIGSKQGGANNIYNGLISELLIYDSVLTPQQAIDYANGVTPTGAVFNTNITGREATETDTVGGVIGTWSGTGDHSATIPALLDKSATAVGTTLQYPQRGFNAIPETYIKLEENIKELFDADQRERWENFYIADFSTDVDGFATYQYLVPSVVDSQLKLTHATVASVPRVQKTINSVVGNKYRIVFKYYAPSTNSLSFNNFRVYSDNASTRLVDDVSIERDTWIEVDEEYVANTNYIQIAIVTGVTGDYLLIKNLEIYEQQQQTGNNLITNGGARGMTDWVKTTGLHDIYAFEDHSSVIDGATKVRTLGDELNTSLGATNILSDTDSLGDWDGTGAVIVSQNTVSEDGGYAIYAESNTSPINGSQVRLLLSLTVGKKYKLEYSWRHVGIGGEWSIQINGSFLDTIDNTQTNFVRNSLIFECEVASVYIFFRESSIANDGGIYLDNVSIKEITTEDGSDFIDQVPQGAELVTNGDFAAGTDWTLGTGWSIGSSVATCDGTDGNTLDQDAILTINKYYIITYDVTAYTSGGVIPQTSATNQGTEATAIGSYTQIIKADTANLEFLSNSFDGSIDNVSVKELQVLSDDLVTNGDFATDTDWNKGTAWSISGGVASFDDSDNSNLYLAPADCPIKKDSSYLLKFTIANTGTARLAIMDDEVYTNVLVPLSSYSNGTYTVLFTPSNDTTGGICIRAYTAAGNSFDIDNISVHKLTFARQITDSTNYEGLQYLLPIDQYDFAIPVDYVAESIVAQQFHNGLADGWASDALVAEIGGSTTFANVAQRIDSVSGDYIQFDTDKFEADGSYLIVFKYRSSDTFKVENEGVEDIETGIVANTGTALSKSISYSAATAAGKLRFTLEADGYLEIDEVSVKKLIDGRFYEPDGTPIAVKTDDLPEQRYGVWYMDKTDGAWKNGILVGEDITYEEHLKLAKYTKNN